MKPQAKKQKMNLINDTMQNEASTAFQDPSNTNKMNKIEYGLLNTKKRDVTSKQHRRVRFHTVERIHQDVEHLDIAPNTTDTSVDEETNHDEHLWYQTEDFRRFRADDKKLMKTYRGLMKQRSRCQVVVGTTEGSNESIKEYLNQRIEAMEDEIRGLEDYKSIRANIDFKHRRYACCHGVLKEQVRQQKLYLFRQRRASTKQIDTDDTTATTDIDDDWSTASQKFVYDDALIRNCVLNTSMKSKILAHTLGLSDASYVRQQNTTKDSCESLTDENVDKKHHHHHFFEADDDDEKRVLMKKMPPRYSDVDDMTVSPSKQSPLTTKRNGSASSILRSLQLRHLVIPATSYISFA